MNSRCGLALSLLALVVALPSIAYAEPPDRAHRTATPLTFGFGARVGGYGFREYRDDKLIWQDCRMNGTGIFGTLDIGRYLFGEVSADLYNAIARPLSNGMDRTSLHTLAAVGARAFPDSWVTPYVQVGGGPEFTRIELGGDSLKAVLPEAFMGIGGELNWKHLHFGTTLRVFTMAVPTHPHSVTHPSSGGGGAHTAHQALEPDGEVEVQQEAAAQMQFSVRYHF